MKGEISKSVYLREFIHGYWDKISLSLLIYFVGKKDNEINNIYIWLFDIFLYNLFFRLCLSCDYKLS